jgi:predicted Zn-dependent protease
VAARIALVVLALAAAGWLAAAYPGARDEARARALLQRPVAQLTPAERARALKLLEAARRARPDGAVIVQEASLLFQTGRRAQAVALLRPHLRREPDDVAGWTVLALADPRFAAEAHRQQQRLAPPVR